MGICWFFAFKKNSSFQNCFTLHIIQDEIQGNGKIYWV